MSKKDGNYCFETVSPVAQYIYGSPNSALATPLKAKSVDKFTFEQKFPSHEDNKSGVADGRRDLDGHRGSDGRRDSDSRSGLDGRRGSSSHSNSSSLSRSSGESRASFGRRNSTSLHTLPEDSRYRGRSDPVPEDSRYRGRSDPVPEDSLYKGHSAQYGHMAIVENLDDSDEDASIIFLNSNTASPASDSNLRRRKSQSVVDILFCDETLGEGGRQRKLWNAYLDSGQPDDTHIFT